MEIFSIVMKENGRIQREMEEGRCHNQMEKSMLEIGEII